MSLFGTKEKAQIAELQAEVAELKTKLIPEQQQIELIKEQLKEKEKELEARNLKLSQVEFYIKNAEGNLETIRGDIDKARERLLDIQDDEIYQAYALYRPLFVFTTVDEYKEKIKQVREKEKALIKTKNAVTGNTDWTVNNSKTKGRKMVSDMQKLLLRAFNSECDYIIDHVTVANIETSKRKITASRDAISELGKMAGISIRWEYFNCKLEELYLALDYQQKKQEEKEALREARAQLREEAKLAKEIAEARKKLEKEQSHYTNALSKLKAQLANVTEEERPALEEKIKEAESRLEKIDADFKAVDYREANQKAGYVYIISNLGAFGENVYKIGMTRRLEPMDRIHELGDASVPFEFDVHAMIFSDNAPALEAALHNAFADKKLNFVNQRREFFRVSLDEIKKVVKENYDKTVEFVDIPPAEQFRQSLSMWEK